MHFGVVILTLLVGLPFIWFVFSTLSYWMDTHTNTPGLRVLGLLFFACITMALVYFACLSMFRMAEAINDEYERGIAKKAKREEEQETLRKRKLVNDEHELNLRERQQRLDREKSE
jgi:hypothetical protein